MSCSAKAESRPTSPPPTSSARRFYAEKLGLTPARRSRDRLVRYETGGGTTFSVYQTEFAGQAGHTIAQIHVDDVENEVGDLKAKGVAFEV